jgi:hypothetical protein
MTMQDRMTLADIDTIAKGCLFKTDSKELGVYEGGQLHQRLAYQLADTMRENERLRNALEVAKEGLESCVSGINFSIDGAEDYMYYDERAVKQALSTINEIMGEK